jgi:CheY-like chemotaxis protein
MSGDGRRPVAVLVVEDDADIRETLAGLLEVEGYSVATAENGADALALLRTVTPQVILLDLSMPVMSGQQFRSAQLGDPALAAIPTVVMTAADRIRDKIAGIQIDEALAKPLTLQQLLDTIARHCQRQG